MRVLLLILSMLVSHSVAAETIEIVATGKSGIPSRGTFANNPELQRQFFPNGILPDDPGAQIDVEVRVVLDTGAAILPGQTLQSPNGFPASVSFKSGNVVTEGLTGSIDLVNYDSNTRLIFSGISDGSVFAGGLMFNGMLLILNLPVIPEDQWPDIPAQIEDLVGNGDYLGTYLLAYFLDSGGNEGQVELRPSLTLTQKVKILSDETYECTGASKSVVSLESRYINEANDPAASYSWLVNKADQYFGASPDITLKLGQNTVELSIATVGGASYQDAVHITVVDSVAPEISLLVDQLPGGKKNATGRYYLDYEVSDDCDLNPTTSAVAGVDVSGGALLSVNKNGLRSEYGDQGITFSVTATDESQNTTQAMQVVNQ